MKKIKSVTLSVFINQLFRAMGCSEDDSKVCAEVIMKAAGKEKKRIIKEREIRWIDGLDLMVDVVKKIEDGQETELGNFVELHLPNDKTAEEKRLMVCQKLGIDEATYINDSYSEM